jgi:hypothetical protein
MSGHGVSSRHVPGRGDIGAAVIADRAQHARHQLVERGLVGEAVGVENRAVAAIRVAAVDPDLAVAKAALVREQHRLVMEHEVFDRPGHVS